MTTFVAQRQFAAPPEAVYAAFASPQRLARWWGPAGFTNTFERCEFVTGGRWVFTMHGPDGTNHPNENRFVSLVPGREVVIRHVSTPHFTLTVRLVPQGTGTRLEWEQAFDDPAVAEKVRAIVVPANEQNLDRLAAEVGAHA